MKKLIITLMMASSVMAPAVAMEHCSENCSGLPFTFGYSPYKVYPAYAALGLGAASVVGLCAYKLRKAFAKKPVDQKDDNQSNVQGKSRWNPMSWASSAKQTAKWLVPGKKTLLGLGGLGAVAGLAAAYKSGYLNDYLGELDYQDIAEKSLAFGKEHWKAIAGAATAAVISKPAIVGAKKFKKWLSVRGFIAKLKTMIDAGQTIDLDFVKEYAPSCARKANGELQSGLVWLFSVARGNTQGLIVLVKTYNDAQGEEKAVLKRKIDLKIQSIEKYLKDSK